MRAVICLLATLGAALLAFGYWGLESVAGRRTFDEMDGMIPFGAAVLGGALFILATTVIAGLYCWRRKPGVER